VRLAYLHGFGSSARSFKGVALRDALSERGVDLALPDLNRPSFSGLQIGSALRYLLDYTAGHDRWGLIGSSLGGYLAALAATHVPERLQRLILLCPGFGLVDRWPDLLGEAALHRWRHDGRLPFANGQGEMEWVHWAFLEEARRHTPWPVPQCPTLIIHGTKDETVPIKGSRDIANAHQHIALVEVDDDHGLSDSLTLIEGAVEAFLLRKETLASVSQTLNGQRSV
jgi:hypothetical protein